MSRAAIDSAVLLWTNESNPQFAVPGDAERIIALNLHQRVVRVTGLSDGWADIRFGSNEFRVREECLRPIDPLAFDVGDAVSFKGGDGTVRDIIWQFKDGEPNYYLASGGKKVSKRYRERDLTSASI